MVDWHRSEVIVVDDGSDDDTARVASALIAELPHARVLRLPANAGKGAAIRAGVSRARGAVVAFMDADMATDPRDLGRLVAALDDADVAIGSRAHPDSEVFDASASRAIMGRAFNLLSRSTCGFGHRDTQCGFKAFRAPGGRVLFHLSRLNGFAFDVELLLLAQKLGLTVREVPVRWTAIEGSTVRPVRDPLPMALDVVRTRVHWRGDRPLAAVTAIGGRGAAADVTAGLRANLRQVDPVVACEGGAVALLPCTDRSRVSRVTKRLRRSLPDCEVGVVELAPTTLVPRSGGLLRSALAA